jgi:hypothetical protein
MTLIPRQGGGQALPPVTAAALRAPALPVGPGPAPCGPRAVAPRPTRRPGTGCAGPAGATAVRPHGPAQLPVRRASGVPAGGSTSASALRHARTAVRAPRPARQPSDRSTPCC